MNVKEKPASGNLIVGITEDGKSVVINHPDLQPDAEGVGHIVFSPDQAVNLCLLIWKKLNIIRGLSCAHCGDAITDKGGWATAQFRYCFKDACQQEFYKEAQAMIRKVNPDLAGKLEAATLPKVRKENPFTTVDVLNERPMPDEAYVNAPMRVFGEIYDTHFPQSERPLTDEASLPAHFTCPTCKRVSYNPNDLREGYCGACHEFTGAKR